MNKYFFYRSLSGTVLLGLLGACAQFGQQSALEQPADYSIATGKTQTAVYPRWWTQLRDPVLNRLVGQALQNSPNIKIAIARIEQMRAALGVSDAAAKPQLSANASGAALYLADRPASQRYDTNYVLTQGMLGLQGSWSFDFWGRNRALSASAQSQKQAAEYELAQARLMLAQAIITQYVTWQALAEQQQVVQKRLDNAQQTENLLRRRIDAKLLPENAVYPIQQNQLQLQAQQQLLAQQSASMLHSLAVLCGRVPTALNDLTAGAILLAPNLKTDRLRADILSRRPDIASQKMLLNSRYHNVRATRAEFYPNVDIKAFLGLSHIDAFNVLEGTSKFAGVMPALNLPIFTSGALQSKLAGKHAEYNQQVAQYNQTVLNALRDTADAVSIYQTRQNELALQRKSLELSEKQAASLLRRVGAGLENRQAYLQQQDQVLQQQAKVAQASSALTVAWSNVQAQLGGGFYAATE